MTVRNEIANRVNSFAEEFHPSAINILFTARFDAKEKAARQLSSLLFKGE
jgi:hypothetical protein